MRFHPAIGGPPHPQALRLEQTGTQRETGLGADHGQTAAQDIDHLHRLPRQHPRRTTNRYLTQIVTGEPDDRESHHVRFGGGPLEKALHHRDLASGLPDPKKGGKRPLGIPTIADRAQQQRVRNALEPEWEARLDRKQYGFRPGRGCHDAIEMIHRAVAAKGAKRDWVLDADLKSAFDKIDHNFLLERIGTFPAREQIRGWLKAGVVDRGRYSPTHEGTPQGGVISPLLLNIALQGMEEAAGVTYEYRGNVKAGCPTVITYADDFVALCHSREQAETVQTRLGDWLKKRGLSLNKEKTRIGRIDAGFDFLSFNIRRYHRSAGPKVLTTPSRSALKKIRRRNAEELRALRGASPTEVIMKMNPIIRGQANYYRSWAGTHLMILPWPDTGPTGDAGESLRTWHRPGNTPCVSNMDSARCAGSRCSTPTGHPTPSASGRPGTQRSARR